MGISEGEGVRATPDPSVQRPTTASQRVSGHRNPDSRRNNANTAADARRTLRTPRVAARASSRDRLCAVLTSDVREGLREVAACMAWEA